MMHVQAPEMTATDVLQRIMRIIPALPERSVKKLADYVEELIEEEEDAEDIAYLETLTPEDYANAVPMSEVVAEFEAEHGALYQDCTLC